ncbi:Uncharacterised protein [Mycobacteroides abscessus subsp. abscessus]|nr:Uncharacterised protein [Mycobacteroides abscessus subsp. abscessus]
MPRMTGRDRIDQAAKENGWTIVADGGETVYYPPEGRHPWFPIMITYNANDIMVNVRVRGLDHIDGVIAYLQQHHNPGS